MFMRVYKDEVSDVKPPVGEASSSHGKEVAVTHTHTHTNTRTCRIAHQTTHVLTFWPFGLLALCKTSVKQPSVRESH